MNIKGLEAEVVKRLSEQAEAEGVSAQEWMREALRSKARVLSPNELAAKLSQRTPISRAEADEIWAKLYDRQAGAARKAAERVRQRAR